MSRKLKRKRKPQGTKVLQDKEVDLKSPPKKIKRYKAQRCAFVDLGKQCKFKAVGKSTLCKKHGGNPVIKSNLITQEEMPLAGLDTKYNPAVHPVDYIDFSRRGMSDVEIAAQFKVSVETIRSWAEKYEVFNRAFDIGKALHESWWLQQGKGGLNNRGFNTSLFKFLTSNKLGYSDKMETKNMNMNVHGVLMVPDKMTEDEWEKEEDIIDVSP